MSPPGLLPKAGRFWSGFFGSRLYGISNAVLPCSIWLEREQSGLRAQHRRTPAMRLSTQFLVGEFLLLWNVIPPAIATILTSVRNIPIEFICTGFFFCWRSGQFRDIWSLPSQLKDRPCSRYLAIFSAFQVFSCWQVGLDLGRKQSWQRSFFSFLPASLFWWSLMSCSMYMLSCHLRLSVLRDRLISLPRIFSVLRLSSQPP